MSLLNSQREYELTHTKSQTAFDRWMDIEDAIMSQVDYEFPSPPDTLPPNVIWGPLPWESGINYLTKTEVTETNMEDQSAANESPSNELVPELDEVQKTTDSTFQQETPANNTILSKELEAPSAIVEEEKIQGEMYLQLTPVANRIINPAEFSDVLADNDTERHLFDSSLVEKMTSRKRWKSHLKGCLTKSKEASSSLKMSRRRRRTDDMNPSLCLSVAPCLLFLWNLDLTAQVRSQKPYSFELQLLTALWLLNLMLDRNILRLYPSPVLQSPSHPHLHHLQVPPVGEGHMELHTRNRMVIDAVLQKRSLSWRKETDDNQVQVEQVVVVHWESSASLPVNPHLERCSKRQVSSPVQAAGSSIKKPLRCTCEYGALT
ncbi:hypothetical protein WMY93_017482 [Mugilogobius chulae]|uniref:Uncharacterized protein n=1 Tax=Mugilogobius chulae TaxID=88201 RepID=A0AAW0NND8_9GOBI